MEGFRQGGASENIHGQKINGQNRAPKLWPTQRSTVARLGLLRQSRSASQASTSCFESSDTLGSNSSSRTSLFSGISPTLPSSRRVPPLKKAFIPKSKQFGNKIVDDVSPLVLFDRKEALQALKSIQTRELNPTKVVMPHRGGPEIYGGWSNLSEAQLRSEENRKSWENSQSRLSGHESWVTCADFTNSMILKLQNPKEREEFTELCSQALSVKLETYDQIVQKNSEIYQQQMEKVNNFDRDEYKSHLCKVMLKLINNEKLRQEQKTPNSESQLNTRMKKYCKKGIKQVYVVGGRTILGDSLEKENFPNSFSLPSELMDSKYDPPGYQRFKVKVDMKGLPGDKFSIHLYNEKTLMFTEKDEASESMKVNATVELPPGIFADKLRIARKGNGPLIIQEPWVF